VTTGRSCNNESQSFWRVSKRAHSRCCAMLVYCRFKLSKTIKSLDGLWGLADYRAKEYNQSYRAGGRYLAWRLEGGAPPTPQPTPTPTPQPIPSPTPTPTPAPSPTTLLSPGLVSNAFSTASTLAQRRSISAAEISSLVSSIEQAHAASLGSLAASLQRSR